QPATIPDPQERVVVGPEAGGVALIALELHQRRDAERSEGRLVEGQRLAVIGSGNGDVVECGQFWAPSGDCSAYQIASSTLAWACVSSLFQTRRMRNPSA